MKKKTKIIIIAVVAVALVALAVWYFGFYQKKAKETDKEGENKTPVNPTDLEDIFRTDYGVAPAAAYRLNQDLNENKWSSWLKVVQSYHGPLIS